MNILIKFINDVKALCNTIITAVNAIKAKTDTITTNLFTATHASRIDANISSRQASWGATSTHSSRIDKAISSRRGVFNKAVTGHLTHGTKNADSSFITFLNITGKSGILKAISFYSTSGWGGQYIVQITIDNVIQNFSVYDSTTGIGSVVANPSLEQLTQVLRPVGTIDGTGRTNINLDLEFITSCKVEMKLISTINNGTTFLSTTAYTE